MAPRNWLDAQIVPVILAGGSGTRLWPLSRPDRPKQFLKLLGDRSLFQATAERTSGHPGFAAPIVICNAEHRFLVAEQLAEIGLSPREILVEPEGRNTAPAAALAALALARAGDAQMLLLPADHAIADAEAFRDAVGRGVAAARLGHLVTFGILPDRPETGYGYVRAGSELDGLSGCFGVERFVEKPDRATAKGYIADGRYYWNSGIFLAGARTLLDELGRHRPDIAKGCTDAMTAARREGALTWPDAVSFRAIAGESIDYAVMEHTQRAAVVPVDMGWNDVGSWSALSQVVAAGARGNVGIGDVRSIDSSGTYVRAESRLVATIGLENIVVVETPDAVLVSAKDRGEDVKRLVEGLKRDNRPEADAHAVTERPWGWFRTLVRSEGFQVKEIHVRPGARLSLQRHRQRAEQWIVASGQAVVTVEHRELCLGPRGYVDIPRGAVHRLENRTGEPLRVIEVQTGAYLGEDDIERLADEYGRTAEGARGRDDRAGAAESRNVPHRASGSGKA
ncbi:MAG: mannose-1-phosphate guanylyltransferase/mannose-6-phosphate isomerase [Rhodospirillaceae bacterium]|nr:mannose-1-phosphate guanylyltransferase/mannose-6-phosphate isomerase [Rhodospirillaceae bacterium]